MPAHIYKVRTEYLALYFIDKLSQIKFSDKLINENISKMFKEQKACLKNVDIYLIQQRKLLD